MAIRRNFLITGTGRSGTLFLATIMNRSETWTVAHEPKPRFRPRRNLERIRQRFDRDDYGEVNSYLCRVLFDLEVAKKGVIRRNPADLFLSICNWKREFLSTLDVRLPQLRECLVIVDRALERDDIRTIVFERMVSDIDYLRDLFAEFGIDDVALEARDLERKIHLPPAIRYRRLRDLPDDARKGFDEQIAWFGEKHGYELP